MSESEKKTPTEVYWNAVETGIELAFLSCWPYWWAKEAARIQAEREDEEKNMVDLAEMPRSNVVKIR